MNDSMDKNAITDDKENTLDFQQLWTTYVGNWKWFLISVITFILLAGIYLWFTPAKVNVRGKMLITDKSKQESPMSVGMSMLNSLPLGLGSSLGANRIESDEEILMSNSLMRDVVNELNLHTEYRLCSWGRRLLLYQTQPVNVSIPQSYLDWLDDELPLTAHQITLFISKDSKGYTVETTLKENKEETDLPDQTFTTLPATIKTERGTLTLTENTQLPEKERENYQNGYTVKVTICPPMIRAMDFVDHLAIESSDKKALDIAYITLEDENALRGINIVNELAVVYNRFINDEKNKEAQKTEEFVNERLAKIDGELGASDDAWERSKERYQITEPVVDAQEIMQNKSIYESKLVEIGTQLQLHDYLNDYINNPDNLFEIIPTGLDSTKLISQHNALVNQRKMYLKSMSEKSPAVQRLTESIQELHPVLLTAMKRGRNNLITKREAVQREYSKYMGRVTAAPQMERTLTEIGRQREIKQAAYLLMLQKREETAITLANTTDKGKFIDETLMVKNSKHPKKSIVLLAALILGVIFPMPIFFFRLILNQKSAEDINQQ